MSLTGKELARDLARNLSENGKMVWVEMPLGSVMRDSVGRADVLSIAKSYTNPSVIIYEIKASRGDFLGDISRGKYMRYRSCCNQLYFATEKGLVQKVEVPEGCGLITRSENGWRVVKSAPRADCEITTNMFMALLMRGHEDFFEQVRELDRKKIEVYQGLNQASNDYGVKVARDIANSVGFLEEARTLNKKIEEALGREFSSLYWGITALKSEVNKLLGQHEYVEEIACLSQVIRSIYSGYPDSVASELKHIADRFESKMSKKCIENGGEMGR